MISGVKLLRSAVLVGHRFAIAKPASRDTRSTLHRDPVALLDFESGFSSPDNHRYLFVRNMSSKTAGSKTPFEVQHDVDKRTFYLKPQEGESAVLKYDWVSDGVIDFHHTEVPAQFRGQGVAKHLAKAGLDFAVEKNVKVVLSCSYMAKYVADNPLPEYTKQLYENKL